MTKLLGRPRLLILLGTLPLLTGAVLACEASTDGGPPDNGHDGGHDSSTPPGNDASVEPACPTTTTGPTVHKGEISGDEVWTAATGPHVIEATVNVRNGAKLTIEPCVEVRLAKSAYLQIAYPITPNQGSLVAEGTAKRPIRFVGQDGARWSSLAVHTPGTARLAYVTFENGGGGDFQDGATIAAYGDGEDGADPIVFVDHVTITKSLGTGAWFQRGSTFLPGSRDLTIRESGSEISPYPIEIEEPAIDALPSGSYTGNEKDEILLDPRGGQIGGSGLLEDATLHERGVPYRIGRLKDAGLAVGGRTDKKVVTLTIEPGVVMRFQPGGVLKVQTATSEQPSTAALRALGTAERPIVLTSVSDAPAPGAWRGIWYGGVLDAKNKLDHVRIEYAGADCGCILNTCSNLSQHDGAIVLTAQPHDAFITNTVFANISSHAITQGYDGSFVNFRPSNTFQNVSGCEQTRPRITNPGCPKPLPACD